MRIKFVDIDGVPTRCLHAGEENAYPLLLLHGLTMNAEVWLRNIDALAEHFHVVAPDMLGHGFSGPIEIDDRPMLQRKVAHLRQLVDTLGFDRFCASGSSYGALIAVLLYFQMPGRIDRLVINGSGSSFNTDDQLVANMQSTYDSLEPVIGRTTPGFWRERMQGSFYRVEAFPDEVLMSLLTAYARDWTVQAWKQSVLEMADLEKSRPFRILHRLEEIAVDTLVTWGRNDPGAIYESALAAVARMPAAHMVTFEECGHFPMLEHPERYNQVLLDFIAERR